MIQKGTYSYLTGCIYMCSRIQESLSNFNVTTWTGREERCFPILFREFHTNESIDLGNIHVSLDQMNVVAQIFWTENWTNWPKNTNKWEWLKAVLVSLSKRPRHCAFLLKYWKSFPCIFGTILHARRNRRSWSLSSVL